MRPITIHDKLVRLVERLENGSLSKAQAVTIAKSMWKQITPLLQVKMTPEELVNEWHTEQYWGE